jgi:hypothetical protein
MLIKLNQAVNFFVIVSTGLLHCQDRLPGEEVYLQCPIKDPIAFYCACGFLQINLQDTTGIELLTKTIAFTLCSKNARGCAWIVPASEKHCMTHLMRLCSHSLLNTPKEVAQDKNKEVHAAKDGGSDSLLNSAKEDVEIQNDLKDLSNGGGSSNVFLWCQTHHPNLMLMMPL